MNKITLQALILSLGLISCVARGMEMAVVPVVPVVPAGQIDPTKVMSEATFKQKVWDENISKMRWATNGEENTHGKAHNIFIIHNASIQKNQALAQLQATYPLDVVQKIIDAKERKDLEYGVNACALKSLKDALPTLDGKAISIAKLNTIAYCPGTPQAEQQLERLSNAQKDITTIPQKIKSSRKTFFISSLLTLGFLSLPFIMNSQHGSWLPSIAKKLSWLLMPWGAISGLFATTSLCGWRKNSSDLKTAQKDVAELAHQKAELTKEFEEFTTKQNNALNALPVAQTKLKEVSLMNKSLTEDLISLHAQHKNMLPDDVAQALQKDLPFVEVPKELQPYEAAVKQAQEKIHKL